MSRLAIDTSWRLCIFASLPIRWTEKIWWTPPPTLIISGPGGSVGLGGVVHRSNHGNWSTISDDRCRMSLPGFFQTTKIRTRCPSMFLLKRVGGPATPLNRLSGKEEAYDRVVVAPACGGCGHVSISILAATGRCPTVPYVGVMGALKSGGLSIRECLKNPWVDAPSFEAFQRRRLHPPRFPRNGWSSRYENRALKNG